MNNEQINMLVKTIELKDIISFIEINKIKYFKYRIACIKGQLSNMEVGVNNE